MSDIDIMPRPSRTDLLQGTLDLLILRTLQTGPGLHGWAISERIQQVSENVLQVNQGSLYPALHRLEHQGWIAADWGVSELGRRARFYRLTAAGRRQLDAETREWQRVSGAIGRVLELA
jgi:transcriptional regulator